ncbi:hypothetical protein GCM10010170_031950 [Dactylosporangium salmoneum]|uniref:RelA/SpoT domain-containing protein n=1 Tax=Dactylosporangium salmoneum TaxID=53361 RepID=A0ABN3G764_9ACTN
MHAEHGIDAATARLIEHTRIDFPQPDPEHPVAAPRAVVDGPRLHADPIRLAREIIEQDHREDVPFFDAETQARQTVRVIDGRLYDQEGLPLHGHYIFAVGEHGQEIHAMRFSEAGAINAKHSSLFAGGNVHAAGELRVENGRLVSVDNHSGHYTPVADHVSRARDAFRFHGTDLGGAEFRVSDGDPTPYSRARGEEAFDRAVAELGRPGEIDGVVGVHRVTEAEGMARTGDSALLRVELADGTHVEVDATGVRDFLRAGRYEGPDAAGVRPDRIIFTSDHDLALQGSDQLRDRIEAALPDHGAAPSEPRAAVAGGRPDHVLTELDRLLAERLGQQPLHDRSGEPLPPPRHTNHSIAALRDLSHEQIRGPVDAAGLSAGEAAHLVGDLVARRDAVLARWERPPLPEEVQRMTDAVRQDLEYRRNEPSPRDVYDTLREQAHRKTADYSSGMTIREAARAMDEAVVARGGTPRYERIIDDFLATPEGRAHHEAMIGLDLATSHGPRFDLVDEGFRDASPEWVAARRDEHAAGWTEQEQEALRRYGGTAGYDIDHYLRTGEYNRESYRADAYRIQNAMRESTADLSLHGYLDPSRLGVAELSDLPRLIDADVTMDGFTRLAADDASAPMVGTVRVVVDAPSGTPMSWIGGANPDHVEGQGHVVLPAGARLHVLGLERLGYDRYELRLRYEGYDDPAALTGRLHDDPPPPDQGPFVPEGLTRGNEDLLVRGDGLPMTAEQARDAARGAGVDLRGIEIRVVTDVEQARFLDRQGVAAFVPPEEGGRVLLLGPAAFADHDTLAATLADTLRDRTGDHLGDPLLGGDDVRLDRPGPADLGHDAGGRHRAGDGAGQWDRGPGEGAGDRAGEPAGPPRGLDDAAGRGGDAEPGRGPGGAHGGGDPGDPVHVSRGAGERDDLGGDAGGAPVDDYRAGDILAALRGDPAPAQPGDHPGAGGAAGPGGGHEPAVRAGAAPDPAAANLDAHRAVQERVAPVAPELANVVEQLLDDPHPLNVTNSLRNPALREVVLGHIEELGRGDALAPYGGDLTAFLEEHPGQGPLYEKVPPHVNKVVVDGVERTRLDVYVERLKTTDPALDVGAHPTEADMTHVRDYARRLVEEVKPEVDRQLNAIADRIRATTDGPVDYNSRPKDAEGLIDKVGRMSRGRPGAPPRDWYRVGDIVDAVGARITVPDTASLARTLRAVVEHFGVGDGGRIVEVDNMYAAPKSKSPEYRVIPLCIGIEVNGHHYAFELQLTTLRASIAADIEHNSLYKPYVVLGPADAEAVRRAFEEAAALDQLEDSS